MESLVFVTLAPLALVLMLVVGLVAWRRRRMAGGWALVAFSVAEAGWLSFDTLAVLASTPEATIRWTLATYFWAPLLGVAWLAFVLDYTDRFTKKAKATIAVLTVWSVFYGALSVANESHLLVWSSWGTRLDGDFLGATYTLGPLALAQSVVMWSAMLVSLGAVILAYAGANSRTRVLSRWIAAGAVVPMTVSAVHLMGVGTITKDFTPIAMACSSAAFALGLARYRFLDLRPVARAALVEDLSEGMLVLDTDDRIADLNPAFCAIFPNARSKTGEPLSSAFPRLWDAVEHEAEDLFRLEGAPGTRYFDVRVSPLRNRRNCSNGRLLLLHDVTRRREERAEMHRANADLYDANRELEARNEELDAFAHTVAHDLKNSIQGVLGYAEVLLEDGADLPSSEHKEVSTEVIRAAHKMDSIVHELLMLARVREAELQTAPMDNMHDVVEEALERVNVLLVASGARLSRPSVWPVSMGHAPWVEEIWVNYLSNALKYGGSSVMMGAESTRPGTARYWVYDDGPGLTPEAQAQLFVPFSRLHAERADGHGLGLSIVRRIVERLGGTCGVESAPGMGTRFWFALPLAPEAEALADLPSAVAA